MLSAQIPFVPYQQAFPQSYPVNETGTWYKSFYDAYYEHDHEEKAYLIPRIIHFIWLGSKIPLHASCMIETWRQQHPGWIIKIWADEDVEPFGLRNKEAFNRTTNFGQKSDIFRYEILYRFGGVYVDIDFECLKPFDELHTSCEFYTGVSQENNYLYNGLIGIREGHPLMQACIEHLKTTDPIPVVGELFDALRIMYETGPYYFTRMFHAMESFCTRGTTLILPPIFIYPIPHSCARAITPEVRDRFIRPESLCIHHWECSWAPSL